MDSQVKFGLKSLPLQDGNALSQASNLPLEVFILLARAVVVTNGNDTSNLIRLTSLNARIRDLLIGTAELWATFTLSNTKSSHTLGRLFITRSRDRLLDIYIPWTRSLTDRTSFESFGDCLEKALPRIARLSICAAPTSSLRLINSILARIDLPKLTSLDLVYDPPEYESFVKHFALPANGTNLRSLSIIGAQQQPFVPVDFRNLIYLTIGAGSSWKWMSIAINTFLSSAVAIQELHLVGDKGVFHTYRDAGFLSLTLPALRFLRFVNTAAGCVASFLRELNAPLLEKVEMTTPPYRLHDEDRIEVFVGWDAAASPIMREPSYALPVKALKLRDGADVEYDGQEMIGFVAFLSAIFPKVSRLELEGKSVQVLNYCRILGEKRSPQTPLGWTTITEVRVCDWFGEHDQAGFETTVKYLTDVLRTMKIKRVMSLTRLELNCDRCLLAPVGKVDANGLSFNAGELSFVG